MTSSGCAPLAFVPFLSPVDQANKAAEECPDQRKGDDVSDIHSKSKQIGGVYFSAKTIGTKSV